MVDEREAGFPRASLRQRMSRANAAWERDDYAGALAEYRGILLTHPDFPDVRNRVGVCRSMLGDPEGALEEFDHALQANPEYAEAHLNRALTLNDLGRFEEAAEAFERARELDHFPGDPFPADLGNRIAVAHAKLGDLYLSADRAEAAVREYQKALEIRPAFVDIRSRLAQGFFVLGEYERAAAELRRVLEEHPSFLSARLRLGATYRQLGRPEEAAAEWRTCLELEPSNPRARAYLASVGVRVEERA